MTEDGRPEPRKFDPPPGEWLYKYADEVFGPVPSSEIVERMFAGEVDESTPVSLEEGEWMTIGQLEVFQPFLYQAKAHLRALQARREAELAARRRRLRHRLQVAAVAVVLVLASFVASYLLIVYQPWRSEGVLNAWAAKHVPLLAAVPLGHDAAAGGQDEGEVDLAGINIEQILIDDAPALVAIAPHKSGRKGNPTRRRNGSANSKRGNGGSKPGKTSPAGGPGRTTASLGALSNDEITRVVYSRANLRRLYGCLRAEVKRNPDLPAQVIMEFTINNDGRVSQVRMDDTRLNGGSLHRCFQSKLSRLRFRAFSGQVRNVTMPFKIGS